MGLFGLAVVLGAILHLFWPDQANKRAQGEHTRSWFLSLVAGLLAYTAWTEWTLSPTRLLEAMGRGEVGRFVLGLALGFGTARALQRRFLSGVNFLWLCLTALLVAISAPHMDNWLSKLASFKTSAFEVQLAAAANTNYKVAVAADQEILSNMRIFFSLKDYGKRIQEEIDYIELVEIGESAQSNGVDPVKMRNDTDRAKKIRALVRFFDELVVQLTACYSDAVSNGASIERLREVMRPHAMQLYQNIRNQDVASFDKEKHHDLFWRGFAQAAKEIDKTRPDWNRSCSDIVQAFFDKYAMTTGDEVPGYPRISEFRELPYLYNTAAALLSIVNETDAALKMLEESRNKVGERIDYFYLNLMGQFRYIQGQPAESVARLYEEMRSVADARQRRLDRHCAIVRCDSAKEGRVKRLRDRHRRAEILAMNWLVYRVSEDLARGVASAKGWEVTAERYATELKRSIDEKELRRLDSEAEHYILDTYAYLRIVVEAQKARPDTKVFREMQRLLQGVVERFEESAKNDPSRYSYWLLNAVRVHYNSARELSGE